jgi:hypothetical protein
VVKVPGMRRLLSPLAQKARRANFNFDKATSLEIRIIFLESVIAGLEERVSHLEDRN